MKPVWHYELVLRTHPVKTHAVPNKLTDATDRRDMDIANPHMFSFPLVISGWAGIGKTSCAERDDVLDLESSLFHWTWDDPDEVACVGVEQRKGFLDAVRFENPKWPNNYVQTIMDAMASGNFHYILICQDPIVRYMLDDQDIPYALVYPQRGQKADYLRRYAERGNAPAFVNYLDENFDEWLDLLEADEGHAKVILDQGEFLSDFIEYAEMCLR